MRQVNQNGLVIIKKYEGLGDGDRSTPALDPYLCPAGVWTIGYGHAIKGAAGFLRGQADRAAAYKKYPNGLTLSECEALLAEDVAKFAAAVEKLVKVKITDNQFAALVSFAYNFGEGALKDSTLLKLLNSGKPAVVSPLSSLYGFTPTAENLKDLSGAGKRKRIFSCRKNRPATVNIFSSRPLSTEKRRKVQNSF